MAVDNKTVPRFISVYVDDNPTYLKELRKEAALDGFNEKDKKLKISEEHHIESEEYYFDNVRNEINISMNMVSSNGSTGVYLTIPLSDDVLIDILQYSIKRLNKLKTAIKTLK